jgi:hypothetical protein
MKDFNYWDKLHKNEELEEFSNDSIGLLWLKTKSISRKELITEFLKINNITLKETALAKQFVELFGILSDDLIKSNQPFTITRLGTESYPSYLFTVHKKFIIPQILSLLCNLLE